MTEFESECGATVGVARLSLSPVVWLLVLSSTFTISVRQNHSPIHPQARECGLGLDEHYSKNIEHTAQHAHAPLQSLTKNIRIGAAWAAYLSKHERLIIIVSTFHARLSANQACLVYSGRFADLLSARSGCGYA